MSEANPFEVISDAGGRLLRGSAQPRRGGGPPKGAVATFIAVCAGAGSHGTVDDQRVVMEIPNRLWAPDVHTTLKLFEPERDATVCSTLAQVGPSGRLEMFIYVDDPATTAPDPGPRPGLGIKRPRRGRSQPPYGVSSFDARDGRSG